jgi:Tfp pilus assembly PilM family ATPase
MATSVYLSNEEIIVISGKASKRSIKVKEFHSVTMPEGAIINGIITNEDIIKQTLFQMRKKRFLPKKNIHLIMLSPS